VSDTTHCALAQNHSSSHKYTPDIEQRRVQTCGEPERLLYNRRNMLAIVSPGFVIKQTLPVPKKFFHKHHSSTSTVRPCCQWLW